MAELNTILHIEDEEDIQQIARMALEMVGGMEVVQFSGGPAALEAAGNVVPDMLLLDQMMPQMTGEETLGALRQLPGYSNIPAVFMTAQTSVSSDVLLARTDAVAVISKPFDPMSLADELRSIWRSHSA